MDILTYVQEHPYQIASALLTVYEAFARMIPTEGNWSIVHNLAKVLDYFVKNRAKEEGTILETTSVVVKITDEKIVS